MNTFAKYATRATLLGALATFAIADANAIQITTSMTCDNFYALYSGSGTTATNFHGNDGNWQTVETYNLNLAASDYLYVAAWSDDFAWNGFLAQMTNPNGKHYSQSWQVTATGIDLDTLSQTPSLALMSTEIGKANAGTNPSGGWVNPTAGWANTPYSQLGFAYCPWGVRPVIDPGARWTWYDSGLGTGYGVDPFDGANHKEFLIYRIQAEAVPEPGSLAILGSGLAAFVRFCKRKKR